MVTLYKLIEVKKGVSEGGYTEVILPKDVKLPESKIVIKGAYNLLSAMKNTSLMAVLGEVTVVKVAQSFLKLTKDFVH